MRKRYQVAIVGAGPSTIFAALTLSNDGLENMAIFERGKDIHERKRGRGMELPCGWEIGVYTLLEIPTELGVRQSKTLCDISNHNP